MKEKKSIQNNNEKIIRFTILGGNQMPSCVRDALEYLDMHFNEKVSIEELAKSLFISESYLMQQFKRVTGIGIHLYLTKQRIHYAVSLMKTGITIQESSELVGYQDYSLFYKNFQKQMGESPKAFMQGLHNNVEQGKQNDGIIHINKRYINFGVDGNISGGY